MAESQKLYAGLNSILQPIGQQHLLQWWDDLNDQQRQNLAGQIEGTDFDSVVQVWKTAQQASGDQQKNVNRGDVAQAPDSVVLQPATDQDRQQRAEARAVGEKLLADGQVAVITVAGGQGSRLGFDHPKGMFEIGPVSNCTLFQIFAEQLKARRKRHSGSIPWLIMTSAATHEETRDYFQQNDWFGLGEDTVQLFQQGSLPAVDAQSGQVLLAAKDAMALSPDGHGGLVTALKSSGLLDRLTSSGVTQFFYHQVDNPTVIMCDPVLLGLHKAKQSQLTTNVVRKVSPTERMGALATVEGKLQIIEYSELTETQASRKNDASEYVFWAGNTAIHVFSADFLHSLTADGCQLDLHLAHKKVAYLNSDGQAVTPDAPNANKFERFIFDALPLAKTTLIVEGDRDREFNPVKNATGSDSPETARAAISRIAKEWMSAAGIRVESDAAAEICPSLALDQEEFVAGVRAGHIESRSLIR